MTTNNFTAPKEFTNGGKLYVYDSERTKNDKGHLFSEPCYYYRINGTGDKLPFPKTQLIWMITSK